MPSRDEMDALVNEWESRMLALMEDTKVSQSVADSIAITAVAAEIRAGSLIWTTSAVRLSSRSSCTRYAQTKQCTSRRYCLAISFCQPRSCVYLFV